MYQDIQAHAICISTRDQKLTPPEKNPKTLSKCSRIGLGKKWMASIVHYLLCTFHVERCIFLFKTPASGVCLGVCLGVYLVVCVGVLIHCSHRNWSRLSWASINRAICSASRNPSLSFSRPRLSRCTDRVGYIVDEGHISDRNGFSALIGRVDGGGAPRPGNAI